MRKLPFALLICICLVSGCTYRYDERPENLPSVVVSSPISSSTSPIDIDMVEPAKNIIRFVNSYDEQPPGYYEDEDLDIMLFAYDAGEEYQSMEVWMDTYHYGEKMEGICLFTIYPDEGGRLSGQFSVTINPRPIYTWMTIDKDAYSKADLTKDKQQYYNELAFNTYRNAVRTVSIEDGKDLVIAYMVVTDPNGKSFEIPEDMQSAETQTAIAGYNVGQNVKCRFNK